MNRNHGDERPCDVARLGAVVVTYRPSDEVGSNILRIAAQVNHVCVVDNSERPHDWGGLDGKNITVISNAANLGIACALNQGVSMLFEHSIDDVLLFDQDSVIPDGFAEGMCHFRNRLSHPGVSICAPNFVDVNSNTQAWFAQLGRWRYRSVWCEGEGKPPLRVNFAITSGTLFGREVWQRLGRFRDDYFIDHVDSEYCLRAARSGIPVIINCGLLLQHAIGNRTVRKLLGVTIKPNNHSPLRRYYITRNGIRVMLEYGVSYPSFVFLSLARLVHEILAVMFFESERLAKLRAILRGVVDGLLGRMGPADRAAW